MKLQLLKSTVAAKYGYGMTKFRKMLVDAGINNKNKTLTPAEYELIEKKYGKAIKFES